MSDITTVQSIPNPHRAWWSNSGPLIVYTSINSRMLKHLLRFCYLQKVSSVLSWWSRPRCDPPIVPTLHLTCRLRLQHNQRFTSHAGHSKFALLFATFSEFQPSQAPPPRLSNQWKARLANTRRELTNRHASKRSQSVLRPRANTALQASSPPRCTVQQHNNNNTTTTQQQQNFSSFPPCNTAQISV